MVMLSGRLEGSRSQSMGQIQKLREALQSVSGILDQGVIADDEKLRALEMSHPVGETLKIVAADDFIVIMSTGYLFKGR